MDSKKRYKKVGITVITFRRDIICSSGDKYTLDIYEGWVDESFKKD